MTAALDGTGNSGLKSSTVLETDVLVLGTGLSGLTLAYRLQQQGCQVMAIDSADRVGGVITTRSDNGFRWEEGPNSFTPSPELLNLIADVGIANRLVWADGKLPRFVYWEGELIPVPMSPPALISSKLLTLGAKLRALRGVLGFGGHAPDKEETVREFFSRQLGPQVVERLVGPFSSGVYAGDIDRLSARAAFARVADLEANYGSILAVILRSPKRKRPELSEAIQPKPKRGQLGNFIEGLQELPEAIAQQLGSAVNLRWEATAISHNPDETDGARYSVAVDTPTGPATIRTRSVALTAPAYRAAPILSSLDPELTSLLNAIPYPHVGAVTLAYPADALPQPFEGFGQLFPRSQGLRTLGTIWTSSLFPGRAPAGYHCTLSYIGGGSDPDIASLSDGDLAATVHSDLCQTLLVKPTEPRVLGVRRWTKAIPQYTLGHRERLARIRDRLSPYPGIVLCTNYLDGVSLGDCVKRAEAQVEPILAAIAPPK